MSEWWDVIKYGGEVLAFVITFALYLKFGLKDVRDDLAKHIEEDHEVAKEQREVHMQLNSKMDRVAAGIQNLRDSLNTHQVLLSVHDERTKGNTKALEDMATRVVGIERSLVTIRVNQERIAGKLDMETERNGT